MSTVSTDKFFDQYVRPALFSEENKILLGTSLMIMLAGTFTLQFVGHTYFADGYLDVKSPGFWIIIGNSLFVISILLLNKQAGEWTWSNLGFARQKTWWHPTLIGVGLMCAIFFLSVYVQPYFLELGPQRDLSHLLGIRQNKQVLILALFLVWITAALIQELIFRAFLINSLDIFLGRNKWSTWVAVFISAVIFGLLHAWQGIGGMLFTGIIGLIFGIAYILNDRRILPLILAHGLIDTISLVGIYNME